MSGKTVFSGKLSFISLADIFQILGGNSNTGVLHLKTQFDPNTARIHFLKGNPINASNGSLRGLDAVYSLFGWVDGSFEFYDEKVRVERTIKNSRMEIVLDALRMVDDGDIKKVGPLTFDEGAAGDGDGAEKGKGGSLHVIKGPLPDYIYVVDEEEFLDGRQIVKQGGYGKWIWVILEGQVKVTKDTQNGPLPIAMMGEGSFLGTFSSFLFQEVVRSASLTTIGNVRLGLLDNERLATEYGALSPEFRGILVSLDRRLRKITDRAVELFLKKDSLMPLTKNKKIILKTGSTQEKLFVISEGEAMVMGNFSKKHTPLMTIEKEDFFGYIPFLEIGHEPRSASVMGSADLKANTLDLESLQREYDHMPETFRNLINNISTNIAMTTRLAARLLEGK